MVNAYVMSELTTLSLAPAFKGLATGSLGVLGRFLDYDVQIDEVTDTGCRSWRCGYSRIWAWDR